MTDTTTTVTVTAELDVTGYSGDDARKHARSYAQFALMNGRKDYHPGSIIKARVLDTAGGEQAALLAALQVITLTDHIVVYLQEHDPKALQQARRAVYDASGVCGAQGGAGVFCDRLAGHEGRHSDRHDTWSADACPSRSGALTCDRPAGHPGPHGAPQGDWGARASWRDSSARVCPHCGAPSPKGYVTCGKSECQQAAYEAQQARDAARCPVCGEYLGDLGECVTVGCSEF